MKMLTQRSWASCLCLLTFLPACSRPPLPPKKVEGQILLLVQAGQPFRLAGIPVVLVDSNATVGQVSTAWCDATNRIPELPRQVHDIETNLARQFYMQRGLLSNLEGIRSSLVGLDGALAKVQGITAKHTSEEAVKGLSEAEIEEYKRLLEEGEFGPGVKELMTNRLHVLRMLSDHLAQLSQISNRVTELHARQSTLHRQVENLAGQALMTQTWPGILQTTTTDAEGRFRLNVPPGTNALIVALGRRELLGSQRDYLWILPPPTQTETPLLLNNANLFQPGEGRTP